jgi:hypothetical protein
MKWSRFIFSIVLSLTAIQVMADSIYVSQPTESKYDLRVLHYRKHWAALIPTQFVIQNAGNMGVLSAGIGWNYGKRKAAIKREESGACSDSSEREQARPSVKQWETDLLVGFIPKHQSTRAKVTFTLKENYIPWSINLGSIVTKKDVALIPADAPTRSLSRSHWSIEPLTASLYLNTVYGHEFWKSQPSRYPDKYYEFMSTKFRLNIALGQRVTVQIPTAKRKRAKSVSLFYEVSTCDLYIRSMFQTSGIPLKDILGLSLGVKLQTL